MEKIKIVIIGAGVRGRYTYGDFIKNNQETCEVVAVVENKIGRRKKFKEKHIHVNKYELKTAKVR